MKGVEEGEGERNISNIVRLVGKSTVAREWRWSGVEVGKIYGTYGTNALHLTNFIVP